MDIKALDHVNIHTADPESVAQWYEDILGLKRGPRPPIPIPGIWLYAGDDPVIHLVQRDDDPDVGAVSLEHFAFRAEGMAEFKKALVEKNIAFERTPVPGTDIVQFNIYDPLGNHFHVDFRGEDDV